MARAERPARHRDMQLAGEGTKGGVVLRIATPAGRIDTRGDALTIFFDERRLLGAEMRIDPRCFRDGSSAAATRLGVGTVASSAPGRTPLSRGSSARTSDPARSHENRRRRLTPRRRRADAGVARKIGGGDLTSRRPVWSL